MKYFLFFDFLMFLHFYRSTNVEPVLLFGLIQKDTVCLPPGIAVGTQRVLYGR